MTTDRSGGVTVEPDTVADDTGSVSGTLADDTGSLSIFLFIGTDTAFTFIGTGNRSGVVVSNIMEGSETGLIGGLTMIFVMSENPDISSFLFCFLTGGLCISDTSEILPFKPDILTTKSLPSQLDRGNGSPFMVCTLSEKSVLGMVFTSFITY